MKKEFMVSRIEAAQDGSPYVYIGFTDPNDFKSGEAKHLKPFGPKGMGFSSPEDLMKNFPKAMGNMSGIVGGSPADSPTFKLSMREYEELGLRVGEKVSVEIKKKADSGI
jgi:hypothetical protein